MTEGTIAMPDGRTVGFATYGPDDGTPVVWCHGGPGSRLEPAALEPFLASIGLRVIGVDRPGYGLSSLRPGRSIADWVPDGLAVVDHLGIDRFLAVGVSTGGAYSLALAAGSPDTGTRRLAVLCDERHAPPAVARDTMSPTHCHAVWDASDRSAAVQAARDAFGDDGSRMFDAGDAISATRIERSSPESRWTTPPRSRPWARSSPTAYRATSTTGSPTDPAGPVSTWATCGARWSSCTAPTTPSSVRSTPQHTASLLPQATVRMEPGHGHLSVTTTIVEPLLELAAATA